MSLTNDGFVHVSVTDRIGEIAARLKEYIPEVDLSEGEWLYQVVKVAAVREDAIQQEHQRIVDNLSLPLSYGEYLEMQAANMGVYKKTGSRASGIVIGYGPGDGTVVDPGTFFQIEGGDYVSQEIGIFPPAVVMTRGAGSSDTIPYPFVVQNIQSIQSPDGLTEYSGYAFSENVISWDGSGGNPGTAVSYYVLITGNIGTKIPVVSFEFGSAQNRRAGLRAAADGYSTIDFFVEVDISGGSDLESDQSLKYRALGARNRTRTIESMKAFLENLDGVKEIQIEEVLGTDVAYPPDWTMDNEPDTTGEAVLSGWSQVYQRFRPSVGIASIRGVDIRIAKPSVDYVGSFGVFLEDNLGREITRKIITTDDLDYTKGTGAQTVFVELRYGPLFSTADYVVKVSQSETSNFGIGYTADEVHNVGDLEVDPTGVQPAGDADLVIRTRWLANFYRIHLLGEDGYSFEAVESRISDLLDMERTGFGIIGIEHVVQETAKDYIQVEATIFTKRGYFYTDVVGQISSSLRDFLSGHSMGENIPYLGIVGAIMKVPGVHNMQDLVIRKNTSIVSTAQTQANVAISVGRKAIPDLPFLVMRHGNP